MLTKKQVDPEERFVDVLAQIIYTFGSQFFRRFVDSFSDSIQHILLKYLLDYKVEQKVC